MTFCPQLETAPVTDVTVFFMNPIGSPVAEGLGAGGGGGAGASEGRAIICSGLGLASGSIGFNFAGRAIGAGWIRSPAFGDETFVFFGSDGAVCVADRGGAGRAAAGGGASAAGGAAFVSKRFDRRRPWPCPDFPRVCWAHSMIAYSRRFGSYGRTISPFRGNANKPCQISQGSVGRIR